MGFPRLVKDHQIILKSADKHQRYIKQLKTDNPKSLLDQITQINTEGNGNESQEKSEEIKLKTTSESRYA